MLGQQYRASLRSRGVDSWCTRERALAWIWLALIVGGLGAWHAAISQRQSEFGWGDAFPAKTLHERDGVTDAGYYASIAVKVRDGHGFTTNVSLLHKGDERFPAPSSVYPLWPLTWGYLSRVFTLEHVGAWAPALLYLVALTFSYLWIRGLYPRPLLPRLLPGLRAGHVFVCVLGLSSFFMSTVYPIVECLAYALMFLAFWRFNTLLVEPSLRAGAEMGVWLALILLARPQLVVSAAAAFALLAYAILFCQGKRVRYASMLAASVAAFVAGASPWFRYVWSFAPDATIAQVLAFAPVRPNRILSELDGLRSSPTLTAWLLDKLEGVRIAFEWGTETSYSSQYFTFHYALLFTLPIALVLAGAKLSREGLAPAWAWLSDSAKLPHLYALAYGLLAFLALHATHTHAWYFHRRHGLASVVFVALMLLYLLQLRGLTPKLLGLAVLCSGIWLGVVRLGHDGARILASSPQQPTATMRWIDERRRLEPDLVLAVVKPQLVGYRFPDVGFHWFNRLATRDDLNLMASQLAVDYVVVPHTLKDWWSETGPKYERFVGLEDAIVYRPKRELRLECQRIRGKLCGI